MAIKPKDNLEIIIIRESINKHKTLKQRLKEFNDDYEYKEWDTGEPAGYEVW